MLQHTTALAHTNLPFRLSHFYIFPRGREETRFFFFSLSKSDISIEILVHRQIHASSAYSRFTECGPVFAVVPLFSAVFPICQFRDLPHLNTPVCRTRAARERIMLFGKSNFGINASARRAHNNFNALENECISVNTLIMGSLVFGTYRII